MRLSLVPFSLIFIIFTTFISSLTPQNWVVYGLGLVSTTAITYGTPTVCGIAAQNPAQTIKCYQSNQTISVQPNASFEAISGGKSFFCGIMSGGLNLLCWDTGLSSSKRFRAKRIYHDDNVALTDLAVGDAQVCAREVNSRRVRCWRGGEDTRESLFPSPGEALKFKTITSGVGFTCGILISHSRVLCWGNNNVGDEIQTGFENVPMSTLVAGENHACGLTVNGTLVCKGNNDFGQLNAPLSTSAFEFSGLALGANFTCAVHRGNGLVVCWGGRTRFEYDIDAIGSVSFELIAAGLDFICGLTTSNLSLICWGPGWSSSHNDLPLGVIIPGPCVQGPCSSSCDVYPNSQTLCGGSGVICRSCSRIELPFAVPLPPINPPSKPVSSSSPARNWLSLVFLLVGSVGAFAGLCTIIFCLWTGMCSSWITCLDSVKPISAVNPNAGSSVAPPSRSSSTKGYANGSSSKHGEKTESFNLAALSAATNNFSSDNKIGAGSFGTVYKGKLTDGREVAIKKGHTSTKTKKFQEKESAFDSELALLSRLHHKHLVKLVGYCEENDERLLVYEYMINGSLHDHLHNKKNAEKSSSIVNSWKMRIRIALDAARGIEYLHNYAVPTIIHRDIKSSNILLDANLSAKVSDFGLSLLGPENDQDFLSSKAVGTVGYIDPEYFVSNFLTAKSDVYGFGVVLLELLTGKRAVFRSSEEEASPMGIVEYAAPPITAGELQNTLDQRLGQPDQNEGEAVDLVAYTALHCVNLVGSERPSMTDIVATLERALLLCDHASFSSNSISLPSL